MSTNPEQIATADIKKVDTHYRSSGYLRHGGYFDVPLWTHVEGNIWQGGCQDGIELSSKFKTVVSLYPWEKFKVAEGTTVHEIEMFDSTSQELDPARVESIAQTVVDAAWDAPVLVHCQAGINRSSLIVVRALMIQGHTAESAIELVRETRSPWCLCNGHFEQFLLNL